MYMYYLIGVFIITRVRVNFIYGMRSVLEEYVDVRLILDTL